MPSNEPRAPWLCVAVESAWRLIDELSRCAGELSAVQFAFARIELERQEQWIRDERSRRRRAAA